MYNEEKFYNFLLSEKTISSEKAIRSRMSKARAAEKILCVELDDVVVDDDIMYASLVALSYNEDPAHTPMQNVVRKYYKFYHGREFPRLRDYRK